MVDKFNEIFLKANYFNNFKIVLIIYTLYLLQYL